MMRSFLKGVIGDHINLLLAACAYNLKKLINLLLQSLLSIFCWLPPTPKNKNTGSHITKIKLFSTN